MEQFIVNYTFAAVLQLPLILLAAYLLIVLPKVTTDTFMVIWLFVSLFGIITPFMSPFIDAASSGINHNIFSPIIIMLVSVACIIFAAFALLIKFPKSDWQSRDCARGAFVGITAYALFLIASSWWIFAR